jgi:XTP/dITP diphosphohydrolase
VSRQPSAVNLKHAPGAASAGSRFTVHGSRLVLASGNAGKLAELRELFAGSDVELIAQSQVGIGDADETGLSFIENAILKARHAARASNLPALGDDSGLCVDVLHGAPGLYSARYAGVHGDARANNEKLLRELNGVPDAQRGAHFICVLALLQRADDPDPLIAQARWPGRILHAPRGGKGFGYDPIFVPDGHTQSAAELDPALKNRISHRGMALVLLRELLGTRDSGPGTHST